MDQNYNFSNVKINLALTPLAYAVLYFISSYFNQGFKLSWIHNPYHGAAILGSLCYIWSSRFFQPDLDHDTNRPGKGTFPFGETVTKSLSAFLKALYLPLFKRAKSAHYANITVYGLLTPISTVWFYFWAPYAFLLTHRGMSHWPIIGTLTRIWYIHGAVLFIELLFQVQLPSVLNAIESFYFWKGLTPLFFIVCAPVYISDIFHSAGDMVESITKGYSFCPPAIKRGLIAKVLRITI